MIQYGMNLLLWTGELNESIVPVCESLKSIGYDGVEVPLFNYDLDYAAWGRRLDDLGLARTAVTVRTGADNPISRDSAVRRAALDANRRAVECCRALGASHLVGPYHSALGEFSGCGPTADEWQWGVAALRDMAEFAGAAGVMLALEPLNRFETYLVNTPADGARLARDVDHPACRIMYDTFHAHIEEKNVDQAIRSAGDMIAHVHISENDRSTPGAGAVRWDETFDALRSINYDGWLMVEAFGLALPEIAAATKIWRRMFDSELQLARDALVFMRRAVEQRW